MKLEHADKYKNIPQDSDPLLIENYFGDPSAWTFDNLWNFTPFDRPEL